VPTRHARVRAPRKRRLSFNLCIGFCDTYNFGARVRTRDLTRNQTDKSSEDENADANPDPRHQREDVSLQSGFITYARGVIDIEVFVETRAQCDFGSALLRDFVEAPGGFQNAHRLAVFRNFEYGGVPGIIGRIAFGEVSDLQRVCADV